MGGWNCIVWTKLKIGHFLSTTVALSLFLSVLENFELHAKPVEAEVIDQQKSVRSILASMLNRVEIYIGDNGSPESSRKFVGRNGALETSGLSISEITKAERAGENLRNIFEQIRVQSESGLIAPITIQKLRIADSTNIKIKYYDFKLPTGGNRDALGWCVGTQEMMFSNRNGETDLGTFDIFDHELGHARSAYLGIEPLNRTSNVDRALDEIHASIGTKNSSLDSLLSANSDFAYWETLNNVGKYFGGLEPSSSYIKWSPHQRYQLLLELRISGSEPRLMAKTQIERTIAKINLLGDIRGQENFDRFGTLSLRAPNENAPFHRITDTDLVVETIHRGLPITATELHAAGDAVFGPESEIFFDRISREENLPNYFDLIESLDIGLSPTQRKRLNEILNQSNFSDPKWQALRDSTGPINHPVSPLEAALKAPLQKSVPPEIATSDNDLISKVRTAMLEASSLNDGQKFSLQHGFDQMEQLGLTDAERTNLIQFAKHIASGKPVDIPVQVFGDAGKFAARDIVTRAAFLNWAGAEAGGWKGDRAKFNDLLTRANTIVVHQTTDTPAETVAKARRVTESELGNANKPNRFWDPVISEGRSTFTGTPDSKANVTYFDGNGTAIWSGPVASDKLGTAPPDNISRITIQSFNDQPALPNLHATMSAAHENAVAGWIGATTPGDLSRIEATATYAQVTTASLASQSPSNARGIIPDGLRANFGQPEIHDGVILSKPGTSSPSGHFVELELIRTPKGFNPDTFFQSSAGFELPQARFNERAPELEAALKLEALKQMVAKSRAVKIGAGALRMGLAGGAMVLDYAAIDAGIMAYFSGAGGTEIAKQTILATIDQFKDPIFWQTTGTFSLIGGVAEAGIPYVSSGAAAAGPIGMTAMISFGLTSLSLNAAHTYEQMPLEKQSFLKDALSVYPSFALKGSNKISDIDLSRRLWFAHAGLDQDWLKNDPYVQQELARIDEQSPGENLMIALEDFPDLPMGKETKAFFDGLDIMGDALKWGAGDLYSKGVDKSVDYLLAKSGVDLSKLPNNITATEWIKDLNAQSYVDDVKSFYGISIQTAAQKFENALSRVYAENKSQPFIYQNPRGENLQKLAEELMEYPEDQWTAKIEFKRAVNDAVMNGRRQKKGLSTFDHFDLVDFLSADSRIMNDNGLPALDPNDPRVQAASLANGPLYYKPSAEIIASNLVMSTPFATTTALQDATKQLQQQQLVDLMHYRNQMGTIDRKIQEIAGGDLQKYRLIKAEVDAEIDRLRQIEIAKRAMAASDPSRLGQVIMQEVTTGETTDEVLQEFHEEQVATPTNEDWWKMIGYDQSGAEISNADYAGDYADYEETWDDGLGDELFADAAAGSYDGVTQSAKAGDYFFDPIDPGATIDHGVMECPDYVTGGTYFAEHC